MPGTKITNPLISTFIGFGMVAFAAATANAQDAQNGQRVFQRCAICHSVEQGVNKIGPSLYGIVGRPAASLENYNYSPAMQQAGSQGIVWDKETLMEYLAAPREMISGTRMGFPGLPDEQQRRDVVAYLESVAEGG